MGMTRHMVRLFGLLHFGLPEKAGFQKGKDISVAVGGGGYMPGNAAYPGTCAICPHT